MNLRKTSVASFLILAFVVHAILAQAQFAVKEPIQSGNSAALLPQLGSVLQLGFKDASTGEGAVESNILPAQPSQYETPYFVDAAGNEYDFEREAKLANDTRRLPRKQQFDAEVRNNFLSRPRWRALLRSDGTWVPDPASYPEDRADRLYPVLYVLPLGYRGAFRVAWGVPGAPPLQIVNNNIEIYIPASGVYETSSAQALTKGAVASPEHQFYFEHDGKRTVIPHEPLKPGEIGINSGSTRCRKMPGQCYSYFVGSREEFQAARSAKCPTPEAELQMIQSGDDCWDVQPGSTQPVAEIIPPPGKPALMSNEFHGRTLNGRAVVLSTDPSGVTAWRFDGPEPRVPDERGLAAELRKYIETTLAAGVYTTPEKAGGCTPEQMGALLRSSIAGPYHFFRTPYSSKIGAYFIAARSGTGTYDALFFARGEQGWKLISSDYGSYSRQYKILASLSTKISEFVGRAEPQKSPPVVLRKDGTWDLDDPRALQLPDYVEKSFTGFDMNGNELQFTIDDEGRGTWQPQNQSVRQICNETAISDLNRALDRSIELLSTGNVEGFLVEGVVTNQANDFYRTLEKFGDDSKEANSIYDFLKQTGDGERLVKEYGESNFKQAAKKWLLEGGIQSVDVPSTLQDLKLLRRETPLIAPIPFSPYCEAIYTLSKEPGSSPTVRRMKGHGSTWALNSN